MEIEGRCRKCGNTFDAHFTIMPIGKEKCPYCGAVGQSLRITNDESNDPPEDWESPRGDDYNEEEI